MVTPMNPTISSDASAGPSAPELQRRLERLSNYTHGQTIYDESHLESPASVGSWPDSRFQSGSIWVGGNGVAQDARCKLRAADERRRWRKAAADTIDGSPDLSAPALHLDASWLEPQRATGNHHASQHTVGVHMCPDPVGHPYDHMQIAMKGSPLSTASGLSPTLQPHNNNPSRLQVLPFSDIVAGPLSPPIFSDVCFDDSSSLSPQTDDTLSPIEVPSSATTSYTVEDTRKAPHDASMHLSCISACVSVDANNAIARQRTPICDLAVEAPASKRRTMTLPDLREERGCNLKANVSRMFIGAGGDNRRLLRTETFLERAPTPKMTAKMTMDDSLPELSSFRPTAEEPQIRPEVRDHPQKLSRALTAPIKLASSDVPDEPAWMRPMHLVDTGGRSIYKNAHDDGPIRHALCLWCFRTHGEFCKVHRHGYETCGCTEVLDSHYWEDDTWPDDSSDESTSSDR